MLQVDVSAQVRKNTGKGAARSLRRSGQTPAILYGAKSEPISLSLDTHSFTKTLLHLQRRNAVVNLDIDNEGGVDKRHVLIKELQVDPIMDTLEHADFMEISLDQARTFKVPVNYVGKAAGVEMGGEMTISVTEVILKGNPLDIPDFIEIDVTPLSTNDKVACADLQLPENVSFVGDANKVCVLVSAPVASE